MLEADLDNFRAAFEHFQGTGETQSSLALAGALWRFWYRRGYRTEARQRLEQALAADDRPTAERARALNGACAMASESGDADAASAWGEEALAVNRKLGDRWGIANAVFMLGHVAANRREWAQALEHFEESARAFEELGDEHYTLLTNQNVAWMCEELGDLERGRMLGEDALRRAQASGNRRLEAMSLKGLAWHAYEGGETTKALSLLHEAYRIHRDLGERVEIGNALSAMARALALAGRGETAAQVLSASAALYEELGTSQVWVADRDTETLAMLHDQLDDAAFDVAWAKGRELTPDEAVAAALDG
jgi:non-specific serine/threonine protein kinase